MPMGAATGVCRFDSDTISNPWVTIRQGTVRRITLLKRNPRLALEIVSLWREDYKLNLASSINVRILTFTVVGLPLKKGNSINLAFTRYMEHMFGERDRIGVLDHNSYL